MHIPSDRLSQSDRAGHRINHSPPCAAMLAEDGSYIKKLLFDFVTDKVIIYTAAEHETSRTCAHQRRLQHLAGGHVIPQ